MKTITVKRINNSYLVNKAAIPHGDQWVVEGMDEVMDRWDIWSYAASHGEAHETAQLARQTYRKTRIRRVA